jgi:KDO2-lipid IV(A) lauroyltransferase
MMQAFAFALAYSPKFLIDLIVELAVLLIWPCMRKSRNIASLNVAKVYGLPRHTPQHSQFLRQMFRSQLVCAFDTIRYLYRPHTIRIDGVQEVEEIFKTSNGAIVIITGHIGAWELAGHIGALTLGRKFYVLAKRPRYFGEFLNALRQRLKLNVLWTESKSLLRDMLRVLKEQQALGFVMDQRPAIRTSGMTIQFLGHPAQFVSGPALMVAKTKAVVFSLYCVRLGSGYYRMLCHPIVYTDTCEESVTKAMAKDIEQIIQLYPEQWTWNYKRWRF